MSAIPAVTPAVTMQDLELEEVELLPARETLWICKLYPSDPVPWNARHGGLM